MSESKTPRTDAVILSCRMINERLTVVDLIEADFARTLELELNEARKELAHQIDMGCQCEVALRSQLTAAQKEIEELKEQLQIERMDETCSQCKQNWHPSLVESGWCIFCIQKDTKSKLDTAVLSLTELYNYQQRISSPDTKWELPIYQRARGVIDSAMKGTKE